MFAKLARKVNPIQIFCFAFPKYSQTFWVVVVCVKFVVFFVASTGSAGVGSVSASQLPTPRIDEYQYMPLYQGFSGKNIILFL